VGLDLTHLEAALSVRSASGAGAVSDVYAAKAAALRRFRSQAHRIIGRLHGLSAPAASAPTYRAQVSALEGMATSAGRLAARQFGRNPSAFW
jgi:hypothetical protein